MLAGSSENKNILEAVNLFSHFSHNFRASVFILYRCTTCTVLTGHDQGNSLAHRWAEERERKRNSPGLVGTNWKTVRRRR